MKIYVVQQGRKVCSNSSQRVFYEHRGEEVSAKVCFIGILGHASILCGLYWYLGLQTTMQNT